jgi:hypothetical protein
VVEPPIPSAEDQTEARPSPIFASVGGQVGVLVYIRRRLTSSEGCHAFTQIHS